MFFTKKSPRSYVVLYQKFLYKNLSLLLTPSPPDNSSHTSPNATTAASRKKSIVFCAPQESAPVCSGQWKFPKLAANAAIGQSPCVTSIPIDTPRTFIRSRFILFRNHYRGDLSLYQEVLGRPVGASRWRPLWQRVCPSFIRDPKFDRPTICPRVPYWIWCFQRLQSGRKHFPCH